MCGAVAISVFTRFMFPRFQVSFRSDFARRKTGYPALVTVVPYHHSISRYRVDWPGTCSNMPFHEHAPVLAELLTSWQNAALLDVDMCAAFILAGLALKTRGKWSVGPCESTPKVVHSPRVAKQRPGTLKVIEIPNLTTVLNISPKILQWCHVDSLEHLSLRCIFRHVRLRGLKPHTNNAMVGWYDNTRPLVLLHHIPSPNEVLSQQAEGHRVCTLFLTEQELVKTHVSPLAYMGGGMMHARDSLDFLVHDLSHIELFCDLTTHVEQVGFFASMHGLDPTGEGRPYRFFQKFANMKTLWPQFQYVFSDMNCHSTHLLAYLKAKWLMHDEKRRMERRRGTTEEEAPLEEKEMSATVMTSTIGEGVVDQKKKKLGFQEGWPLMLRALGMDDATFDAANKLCNGEKMTQQVGETIRTFFRGIGEIVLARNTSRQKELGKTSGAQLPASPQAPNAPQAPQTPQTPQASLPPKETVTERIQRQVEEMIKKRTAEVQAQSELKRNHLLSNRSKAETFMAKQEATYNQITSSFTLQTSFKASHAARKSAVGEGEHRNSLNYGEIPFSTMCQTLQKIQMSYDKTNRLLEGGVMFDLGSGAGKSVVAAALSLPCLCRVVGIELLQELHDVSLGVLECYQSFMESSVDNQSRSTAVETMLNDFLEVEWYKDADIVFCNTLVFSEKLLARLAGMLSRVASGCYLVHSGRLNKDNRLDKDFHLLDCSMKNYSWGKSSVWILKKK